MALADFLRTKKIKVYPSGSNDEVLVECPECRAGGHKFRPPKLYFNQKKDKGQCWRCSWHGGLPQFLKIMHVFGYVEKAPTIAELKQRLHEKKPKAVRSSLPYHLVPAWERKRSREYLITRGFTRGEAEAMGVMYCPVGFYKGRIILPVCDRHGKYATWAGRDITGTSDKKYRYPYGSSIGRYVYLLDTMKHRHTVWLVEGQFDAWHCRPYAVASFGKHISDDQIRAMKRQGITHVVLMWDSDAWTDGKDGRPSNAKRALKRLRKHFTASYVKLPKKKTDPTKYPLRQLKRWAKESMQLLAA
jgi:DNA primase